MSSYAPSSPSALSSQTTESSTDAVRVIATEAAIALIQTLKAAHGPLMFHQSGGCCDGSVPMCYPQGEFIIGTQDVLLGEVADCPVYMGAQQAQRWQNTQLILDVSVSSGGDDFSLLGPNGERFVVRSQPLSQTQNCPYQGLPTIVKADQKKG